MAEHRRRRSSWLTHRFRRRRGRQSAGEVLIVTLLAFVLASLVNADAMVRRADTEEFGPARDRSLAIWEPVQDVSHVLQLYRLRRLGGWLAGEPSFSRPAVPAPSADGGGGGADGSGDGGGGDGPTSTTRPATTTTTAPPRPEVRRPTADTPLRVYVGGDSMMHDLSDSVLRLAAEDPLLDVTAHYEISSGLTRPDYYDWPAAIAADVAANDPEVVFLLFGANDAQGIVAADGTVHPGPPNSPGFEAEYRSRVEAVMDQFAGTDRLVFWIGLPPMRDGGYHERTRVLNGIYESAARDRPWITYVDTTPLFGDDSGAFASRLPGPTGEVVSLRKGDGIHFNRDGADLLAQHVLARIEDELPTGSRTTTTTTTPTTAPTATTRGSPTTGN